MQSYIEAFHPAIIEKWLKERVLHRYVIENFKKYHHGGLKIIQVKDNKNQFPDLFCLLENGKEAPVEIECQSSNFVLHGHDINYLKENQGFLFVFYKNQDLGFDVPQYLIQPNDFEKWFAEHAKEIAKDTLKDYKIEARLQRTYPKLWFTYLSLKAGGTIHFDLSLKRGTWGVQENYSNIKCENYQIELYHILAFHPADRLSHPNSTSAPPKNENLPLRKT